MDLDCFTIKAKRALGPLSSGYKDYGIHNAPFFPDWNFMLFQSRELGCKKLKGLGELMRTLDAPEGETRLDTKRVGSACFPTFIRRVLLR